MEELQKLKRFAKEVVNKKILRKINKLKTSEDKIDALKYCIILGFELKYYEIERKINELKKNHKDVFFAHTKSHMIVPKLNLLKTDFNDKDFKSLIDLFKYIEKEMKNV